MPAIKFNQYLAALLSEVQAVEDATTETLLGRYLENAEGVQLDGLGDLVGEERQGRDDDDYRNAIRVRIFQNIGSGTPEEILDLTRLLVPDAAGIRYTEYPPAKARIEMDAGTQPANLTDLLQAAAPAGVALRAYPSGKTAFRYGQGRMGDSL